MHGLLAGGAAAGIAIVSRSLRPGETEFLISIIWPISVIAAIPAVWILIQLLPLKPLAHPIWSSAEAAIRHPIAGSISVDTGASVMALARYLSAAAVALLSAAVSVDRQRAEWILFALMTGTAAIALVLASHDLFGLLFLKSDVAPLARAQAIDCAGLGVIVSAVAGFRIMERFGTGQPPPERSTLTLLRPFATCSVAFTICALALALAASTSVFVATGYGLATLAGAMIMRRLGPWAAAVVAALAISVAMILAAGEPNLRTKSFLLAFAVDSPASLTSMSQRMLDDAPVTGTGAGTFAAIAPIYREVDDQVTESTAPTAAATFAIELGEPMLWLIVAMAAGLTMVLLRASLRRGRDSFYPAAGAGCIITLLFLAFVNAGLLGSSVDIIASAGLGLAFAQSKSRSIRA